MFQSHVEPFHRLSPNLPIGLPLLPMNALFCFVRTKFDSMNSWLNNFLTVISKHSFNFHDPPTNVKRTVLPDHFVTDLMFQSFGATLIFVTSFSAVCVAINSKFGIMTPFLYNLNVFAKKPWFTFDKRLIIAYPTAEYPNMLKSPKMFKSTELISSCL